MERLALALLLGLGSCLAPSATARLDAVLPPDDGAVEVAALVVDLDSGETLLARHAGRLVRPASTMKVLTTAAVCRRASDVTLETRLAASAPEGGTLTLLGAGDPFVSTEELTQLVHALRDLGVRRCDRVVVVDPLASAPRFGEGWMWDDEPASFMPPLSAAAVDGGCVEVVVEPGLAGLAASIRPVQGALQLALAPAPGSGDGELTVTRGRYDDDDVVTVAGSLGPGERESVRISVPRPAEHTAATLAALACDTGLASTPPPFEVVVEATPDVAAHVVTLGRAMADVVRRTNKESDNLGAELLLRLLPTFESGAALSSRAVDDGLAALREDLRALGLDPSGYRLSDGSGVSHYTLVSAEALVRTLVAMHARGGRASEVFRESLPVAGVDGTLARRMRGTAAEGRVRAKTGTISGVSNLAGYVDTVSGRRLAFAVLVQDFVGSSAPWRDVQDRLCAALAEL